MNIQTKFSIGDEVQVQYKYTGWPPKIFYFDVEPNEFCKGIVATISVRYSGTNIYYSIDFPNWYKDGLSQHEWDVPEQFVVKG